MTKVVISKAGGKLMTESAFVSQIDEPDLVEILDFWRNKCRDGKPPYRKDVDMSSTPTHLWSHLYLYELTDDNRLKGVHNGTGIVARYHSEGTGLYLDDMTAWRESDIASEIFRECLASGLPVYFHANSEPFEGRYHPFARLVLPLIGDDGVNRFAFGSVHFFGEVNAEYKPPEKGYWNIAWATAEDLQS